MTRSKLRLAVAAALLVPAAADAAGGLPIPTPGLIAAAVSLGEEPADAFDVAARFAAARRFEEAFAAIDADADPLRAGIAASLAEKHEEAVRRLQDPVGNAYLDRYRVYYLARSLRASDRMEEAYAAISSISHFAEPRADRRDAFHARTRELAVEIAAASDSIFSRDGVPPDTADLPGRTRDALARALLRVGRDSLATRMIARAIGAGSWQPGDRDLLAGAIEVREKLDAPMTRDELLAAASVALSAGLRDGARGMVAELLDRNPRDYRALLLKGRMHAEEKRPREAAAVFERILDASAPLSTQQEALERLASLEYSRGRRELAVMRYEEYYERFPEDPRRDAMRARGARIDVSLGRLEAAYEAFREIAGPRTYGGATNLDAEHLAAAAALACFLGREAEIYGMLEERLAAAYGERARGAARGLFAAPAVPYWLWRTASPRVAKDRWLAILRDGFPRSAYALAAAGQFDSLLAGAGGTNPAERARAMARSERAFLNSLPDALQPGGPADSDDALGAYRLFLDWGFTDEAWECASSLSAMVSDETGVFAVLYRDARIRGFHRFALRLANRRPAAFGADPRALESIQYPIAYAGSIAASVESNVPAELLLAVIREESAFDPNAVSRAGAVGLMQLMPATARWLARTRSRHGNACGDLRDPLCSVSMGAQYFAYLLDRFDGSAVGALAAYNGGEGRMSRWKKQFDPAGDPMLAMALIGPLETRRYVDKVLDSMCRYRALFEAGEDAPR